MRVKPVPAPARPRRWLDYAAFAPHSLCMNYTGIVQNGVIVLPPDATLPEGTEVSVTPLPPSAPGFLRQVLERAKPRDWPADYAVNHGHYTKGEPRR